MTDQASKSRAWLASLFRIEPRAEGWLELAIVRVALGLLLANTFLFDLRPAIEDQRDWLGDTMTDGSIGVLSELNFFFNFQYDEQAHPVGLASLWGLRNLWGLLPDSKALPVNIDLTFLSNPEFFHGGGTSPAHWPFLKIVFAVMLVLFCLGVSPVISCGYLAFVVIAIGSLRNSQGNIHHGTQIVSMVVLGHWLGYLWHTCSNSKWLHGFGVCGIQGQRTSFFAAQQLAAAAYVVAGVTKILRSGVAWFWDSPNIAIQVLKIGNQHYYGDGKTAPLEHAQRVAQIISEHPHLTRLMLGAGLLAELFAFFALYNRKMGWIIGLLLVAMHVFVGYLMQLTFPLNTFVLCVYFLPLPFVIARIVPFGSHLHSSPEQP